MSEDTVVLESDTYSILSGSILYEKSAFFFFIKKTLKYDLFWNNNRITYIILQYPHIKNKYLAFSVSL